MTTYCWWKKFCTTWDVWNLTILTSNIGRKHCLSTGAGFLPAAVWINGSGDLVHHFVGLCHSKLFLKQDISLWYYLLYAAEVCANLLLLHISIHLFLLDMTAFGLVFSLVFTARGGVRRYVPHLGCVYLYNYYIHIRVVSHTKFRTDLPSDTFSAKCYFNITNLPNLAHHPDLWIFPSQRGEI